MPSLYQSQYQYQYQQPSLEQLSLQTLVTLKPLVTPTPLVTPKPLVTPTPFNETKEYFTSMALIYRFVRDELIKHTHMYIPIYTNTSLAAMQKVLCTYDSDIDKIRSIIRLCIICTQNIEIQYIINIDETQLNIGNKLYIFLCENLPKRKSIINEIFNQHDIT